GMAGAGTAGDPCIILTPEHLDTVRGGLGVHYRLGANIDLSDPAYSDGEGWLPIGDSANPFVGSLDGDGYTVHDLTIDRDETNEVGLFGAIAGNAAIKNLRLKNAIVIGRAGTG